MDSPTTKARKYQNSRMEFGSNLEFMVTTLGTACGFGSVWRFPYRI